MIEHRHVDGVSFTSHTTEIIRAHANNVCIFFNVDQLNPEMI